VSTPIAIFASGRGSNFDAIESAIRMETLDAKIVAVVSDQPQAPVLEKARKAGLRAIAVPVQSSRLEHEKKILSELSGVSPKFLVLAGYMRIITPHLIDNFRSERGYSRIVNIHPSLLPSFAGVNSYAQAFQHGVKVAGVTVHLVENQVDSGPICAQSSFDISDCESESEVEKRGLAIEHRLYPESLAWILPEQFSVIQRSSQTSGRLCVRAN
jgi:phosphoribosylglycinamide formyltransferase-1